MCPKKCEVISKCRLVVCKCNFWEVWLRMGLVQEEVVTLLNLFGLNYLLICLTWHYLIRWYQSQICAQLIIQIIAIILKIIAGFH